ncbi:MAG: dUTP diphosphatase [Pseudomonadota bacterium]
MTVDIQLKWLPHGAGLGAPRQATALAAGMDVEAAVPADAPLTIDPGTRALVPTGFAMAIPPGYEAQIRPRSGLAFRQGLTVLNTPGTIDADYRGEVQVLLVNLGTEPVQIARGERIAQLLVQEVPRVAVRVVDDLDDTVRGAGGFGSTGRTGQTDGDAVA